MEKKKYYNANLERILKKYITAGRYGDFAPLLEEVFQRRAYEFGFSERTIEAEVQNFTKNVNYISFENQEQMSEMDIPAEFDWIDKKIKLNFDLLQTNFANGFIDCADELFASITHEVYHAINYISENGEMGISDAVGHDSILNEIVIETAANRTSYSRDSNDAERYRTETTAYSDITFIVNLLAAAIGVSEKELLVAGIQINAYQKIIQLINKRLPSSKNYKGKIQPEIFYSTLNEELTLLDRKLGYNNSFDENVDMKSVLRKFYELIYEAALYQIATDNKPFSREYVAEIEYRIRKMDRLAHDSLVVFSQRGRRGITTDDVEEIKSLLMPVRQRLLTQYDGIRIIQQHGMQIPEINYMTLSRAARKGNIFEHKRILKRLGIQNIPSTFKDFADITQDLTYMQHVLKEDFDCGRQWDNTQIRPKVFVVFRNELNTRNIDDTQFVDAAKRTEKKIRVSPKRSSFNGAENALPMQPNNAVGTLNVNRDPKPLALTFLIQTLDRVQATIEYAKIWVKKVMSNKNKMELPQPNTGNPPNKLEKYQVPTPTIVVNQEGSNPEKTKVVKEEPTL